MKKIFIVLLLLVSTIYLSSCQQTKNNFTVEYLKLNEDEMRISDLTSAMVEKFLFEKDKIYDINVYFYNNGTLENVGGIFEIDTKDKDRTMLISGKKEGNAGFGWDILIPSDVGQAIYSYPPPEIDDDKSYAMVTGIGRDKLAMEEGEEYALVFAAYKEGNKITTSSIEAFQMWSFNMWDRIKDDENELKDFNYFYIVTVKFSDEFSNN